MTPEAFLNDLATELRLRGYVVFRSELRPWVESCWSLIEDDPAVSVWAKRWLEQRPTATGTGRFGLDYRP